MLLAVTGPLRRALSSENSGDGAGVATNFHICIVVHGPEMG